MIVAEFIPFPVPINPGDLPLVQHAGFDYVCTGCGAHVPDGTWIYETIDDGVIVGLRMRSDRDGPVIHECGQVSGDA